MAMTPTVKPKATKWRRVFGDVRSGATFKVVLAFASIMTSQWTSLSPP